MRLVEKIALNAALAVAVYSCTGCHSLTPAQQAKVDKFECQVHALEPLVSPTLDAAQLVRDLYAGKADLGQVLRSLDADEADLNKLVQALKACEAPVTKVPEGGVSG